MRSVNKVTGLGHRIVEALVESLGFRQIAVIQEEYAVSKDGMKMFGVLDLEALLVPGCRFAVGIRNSHDKSMRLGLTIGVKSDTPRRAGGLMSWAASKAVGPWV